MRTKLSGGRIYDPTRGLDGEIRDLYFENGRIIEPPSDPHAVDAVVDIPGRIVMAGGIDIHTHIGGGKVNLARTLLPPDECAAHGPVHGGRGTPVPTAPDAGRLYALMGYTTAIEPAVLPANARHAHLEMADTGPLDTGGYALLGNDDFLLQLLSDRCEQALIDHYVGWILQKTRCLGIKVVNPGGINAFKYNVRKLDLDTPNPHYGVTPRTVIRRLAEAVDNLGVPKPLHVHTSNLGIPGNIETTLKTIEAAEGHRLHLAHVQFHSYDTEGPKGFSSGAMRLAEAVNNHPNVTVDVGQVQFGQTVTISADAMHQHGAGRHAHPKRWIGADLECEAGCGVVPFRYRDESFVNALQWAIGLEVFLGIADPWRVFLTTDHPNGGPFTTYPHLIRLLMDRTYRNDQLEAIHPGASKHSVLGGMDRHLGLSEIAAMTRSGPARLAGLADRGHLAPGGVADVTVYNEHSNPERMFEAPEYVFKRGECIVDNGELVARPPGETLFVQPDYDGAIEKRLEPYFREVMTVAPANYGVRDEDLLAGGRRLNQQPCRSR